MWTNYTFCAKTPYNPTFKATRRNSLQPTASISLSRSIQTLKWLPSRWSQSGTVLSSTNIRTWLWQSTQTSSMISSSTHTLLFSYKLKKSLTKLWMVTIIQAMRHKTSQVYTSRLNELLILWTTFSRCLLRSPSSKAPNYLRFLKAWTTQSSNPYSKMLRLSTNKAKATSMLKICKFSAY